MFIKFCGLTRADDVAAAIELGVDAVGFVFWPGSPRAIAMDRAAQLIRTLPDSMAPVGLFVRPTRDDIRRAVEIAGIRVAQAHGVQDVDGLVGGDAWELWVATSVNGATLDVRGDVTLLLDAHDPERHGGTGQTIDWDAAGRIAEARRVWLAGGLTPQNVAEAIRRAHPYGVDVSSGIEDRPGIKSAEAMRAFVKAVRTL